MKYLLAFIIVTLLVGCSEEIIDAKNIKNVTWSIESVNDLTGVQVSVLVDSADLYFGGGVMNGKMSGEALLPDNVYLEFRVGKDGKPVRDQEFVIEVNEYIGRHKFDDSCNCLLKRKV